jgi:eukaryotic-like serine/threonine-protein kinase
MHGDFSLGDWLVQPRAGRATRNGHTVYIRAKVMDLLVLLAERPGEVLSKDVILDRVWGTEALSESALTRSITELRQALGDNADEPSLVETIPKRGYRLIAPVRPIPGNSATGSAQTINVFESPPQDSSASDRAKAGRRHWARWAASSAAAVVILTTAGWIGRMGRVGGTPPSPPLVRFLVSPPAGTTYAAFAADPAPAVSPDGRFIATIARTPEATHQIWVHSLDSVIPQPLPGTDGATDLFWSPDNRFVGYFAHGKLMKVRLTGGPPEPLCDAPDTFGATWSHEGLVLFAPDRASGLHRVPVAGGKPSPVTHLDASRGETSHRFPHFLPDGRRFIYLVRSRQPEHRGIFVGALDSSERKRLVSADSNAVYAAPGYLLFVQGTTLMAQRFDTDRLELTGEPVAIADGVLPAPTVRFAPFAASGGVLTYRTGGMHRSRLTWVDREGRSLASVGPVARYMTLALSPGATALAVDVLDPRSEDVDTWVFDLRRNLSSRVTLAPSLEGYPVWIDASRLAFAVNREGTWNLYERNLRDDADGQSPPRTLIESRTNKYPQAMSQDGQLLFVDHSDVTGHDVWRLPLAGDRRPHPLLQSSFNETQAQVSPDGRWLAYTSDETGRYEVYIRPFGPGSGKWRISSDGGCQPRWRGDGRELFYVNGPRLWSVSIERDAAFQPGVPRPLFHTRVGRNSELTWDYDVTPDGRRFLFKELVFEEGGSPMLVVLNWWQLLAR